MKTIIICLCLGLQFPVLVRGQKAALPADSILKEAVSEAARDQKNVIIIFHASWCGWCHKMDSSMNDNTCQSFFQNNYSVRHLVVQESKNKKHLENPGAMELLRKYNGDDQGIPFWLILDKNGKLLADSRMRPEGAPLSEKAPNCGCPAAKAEVAYFIKVLSQTSSLSDEQALLIEKRFRRNEE